MGSDTNHQAGLARLMRTAVQKPVRSSSAWQRCNLPVSLVSLAARRLKSTGPRVSLRMRDMAQKEMSPMMPFHHGIQRQPSVPAAVYDPATGPIACPICIRGVV